MKKIKIGQTDLEVAPFNFGGNVFGWTLNETESFEILDHYVEAGFDFIDTADSYSHWANNGVGGQSETIIGNWMKARGNRDKMVIATKVGSGVGTENTNSSRQHILKTAEESLKRLQTDYIDLYYTHYDDGKTPVEETLQAYDELIKAGKVRYIAVSNIKPERLVESLEVAEKNNLPKYQALQPLYNLVEREGYEQDFAPLAEKYGLTVFPYYALASGFLTGKYRSKDDFGKSVRGKGLAKYLNDGGMKVLQVLEQVSRKHNSVPAAVSLAWLATQPNIGAPIASATSIKQLDEILSSVTLHLDEEDLKALNEQSM